MSRNSVPLVYNDFLYATRAESGKRALRSMHVPHDDRRSKNQSVPTGYFHTCTFQFLKIHFSVYTEIHSSVLSIGYLEPDGSMKRMFVSQITQRTCLLPSWFSWLTTNLTPCWYHLTFSGQRLTKKLVSFFSELLGCHCVWWLSITSSFFCVSVLLAYYIVCLTIKSSGRDPVWHSFSDTVVKILDKVVISSRTGSLLCPHTTASKRCWERWWKKSVVGIVYSANVHTRACSGLK